MRRAIAGSVGLHALLVTILVALATHSTPVPPRTSPSLEVIDVMAPPTSTPAPAVQKAQPPSASPGSSKPGRARSARRASHGLPIGGTFDDPRGAITFDEGGGGADDGRGTGGGIGFGDGGSIAPSPSTHLVVPPAPKASKARPARLIFPSRQRDVDDGELFVMTVTVDRDGYVAGARLVRGFGGRRDEVASEQIWRFRYDPALDDDGRPVQSTVEQRFLVQ